MAQVLFVRLKSELDPEEIESRFHQRSPRFRDVPGLVQKIYGRDHETGAVCGIYFFETQKALSRFRDSELAKSIADAYEAVELRRETYDVLFSLHPKRGPFTSGDK